MKVHITTLQVAEIHKNYVNTYPPGMNNEHWNRLSRGEFVKIEIGDRVTFIEPEPETDRVVKIA